MTDFDDHAPDGYYPYWDEPNTLDEQIDSLFTDLEVSVGDLYGDFYEEEIREKFHTAKQQLKTLFTEHSKTERLEEAGIWLQMIVADDESKFNSKQWHKLKPQKILKFYANRLTQLSKRNK